MYFTIIFFIIYYLTTYNDVDTHAGPTCMQLLNLAVKWICPTCNWSFKLNVPGIRLFQNYRSFQTLQLTRAGFIQIRCRYLYFSILLVVIVLVQNSVIKFLLRLRDRAFCKKNAHKMSAKDFKLALALVLFIIIIYSFILRIQDDSPNMLTPIFN